MSLVLADLMVMQILFLELEGGREEGFVVLSN